MDQAHDSFFKLLISTMRFNLLWYLPAAALVILYFVIPNAVSGYHNIALVFHRFTLAIFLSPSAYLFFSSVLASVFFPIKLLLMVPIFFDVTVPAYPKRYLWSIGLLFVIVVSAILIQFIIIGSFPLPVADDGYIHLRMIPFIPWPDFSGVS